MSQNRSCILTIGSYHFASGEEFAVAIDDPFNRIQCRKWRSGATDAFLLQGVPADRLLEFQSQFRILADETAADIRGRLFRGVKKPFNYRLATGWMGDALRMDRGKGRRVPAERLGEECGWSDGALVFCVHDTAEQHVMVGQWLWVWTCLQADWLGWWTWNNIVLCTDESQRAAVYWEGDGPRCLNRGDRRLLLPA